ncbi:MAG: hypothetical protein JSV37_06680 [Anaerolineaceae bacterium]|nr:MAG: hypothetical protein JSV37_06680 [Anaerolineaceae bacterium]
MEYAELNLDRTLQYAAYLLLSLIALIFIVILLPSSDAYFRRFFGEMNPIIVTILASIIGAIALWQLQARYNFVLFMGKGTIRGVLMSAAFATMLAIAIVIADFIIRYPEDMNVPVPQALLFYPAVGFVAEIIFHALPLMLLFIILNPLGRWLGSEQVVWLGILLVAVLEPSFQVLFEGKAFTWGAVYSWIHVFAIAFLQLYIFKRFDFVSMYSFRLIYYTYWHILWGVIRLEVLF